MAVASVTTVNVDELRGKVRSMYDQVAHDPHGEFHFEMGRPLAERLGYPPADLDRIPAAALESFAGVGYYFDLAALRENETVVDLGSGSGTDTFIAALHVGAGGRVIGVDMTDAQLAKATRLRAPEDAERIEFRNGLLEDVPVADGVADCVISNGVINLCPDKALVFREIARLLKPGGRVALADIVTATPLPANVTCDATLWAACIGGAAQHDDYRQAIESAGLRVAALHEVPAYRFLSPAARNASRKYGVRSVTVLATKPAA